MATKKEAFRKAFVASIPILCSYLFLGMAYGILMQEQGFGWLESLITSAVVYTGAFQFVLITFLSSGASLLTVARVPMTVIRSAPVRITASIPASITPMTGRAGKRLRRGSIATAEAVLQATISALTPFPARNAASSPQNG